MSRRGHASFPANITDDKWVSQFHRGFSHTKALNSYIFKTASRHAGTGNLTD
jgi:hypothetical protein